MLAAIFRERRGSMDEIDIPEMKINKDSSVVIPKTLQKPKEERGLAPPFSPVSIDKFDYHGPSSPKVETAFLGEEVMDAYPAEGTLPKQPEKPVSPKAPEGPPAPEKGKKKPDLKIDTKNVGGKEKGQTPVGKTTGPASPKNAGPEKGIGPKRSHHNRKVRRSNANVSMMASEEEDDTKTEKSKKTEKTEKSKKDVADGGPIEAGSTLPAEGEEDENANNNDDKKDDKKDSPKTAKQKRNEGRSRAKAKREARKAKAQGKDPNPNDQTTVINGQQINLAGDPDRLRAQWELEDMQLTQTQKNEQNVLLLKVLMKSKWAKRFAHIEINDDPIKRWTEPIVRVNMEVRMTQVEKTLFKMHYYVLKCMCMDPPNESKIRELRLKLEDLHFKLRRLTELEHDYEPLYVSAMLGLKKTQERLDSLQAGMGYEQSEPSASSQNGEAAMERLKDTRAQMQYTVAQLAM